MELLNLLSNEHIILLVDSIMEAVYRGVLERMYENNTPECRKVPSFYSNQRRLNKRRIDFDMTL